MKEIAVKEPKKLRNKILFIIITLLLFGGIWQKVMMNRESIAFQPPGEMHNINSHDLHSFSTGKEDTTVVFVAGSGTPCAYTDFYELQIELKEYAKTISYDHAGYGWSDDTDTPRKIDTLVAELHELLEKAYGKPPYVLVGHSLGSLEVIRFAQQYPEEVKGIVLLDGGSPEFYASDSEAEGIILNRITAGVRVTGVNRILGNIGVILPLAGENLRHKLLPDDIKDVDISMYYNNIGNKSNLNLISNINENAQRVIDNGILKDIPLCILSSDSGEDWEEVQQELLSWSNDSRQEIIRNSQHYIHWSNKEIVIDNILKIINEN